MNFFCHGCSLNGAPWPAPLGTVRDSMKAMTACALRLPKALRVTLDAGQEPGELRFAAFGIFGGSDARSCGR